MVSKWCQVNRKRKNKQANEERQFQQVLDTPKRRVRQMLTDIRESQLSAGRILSFSPPLLLILAKIAAELNKDPQGLTGVFTGYYHMCFTTVTSIFYCPDMAIASPPPVKVWM